jgi:mannose-6-phosphate isomerase-like protein (cupin superfamily)
MKIVSLQETGAVGVSHNPAIKKKVLIEKGEIPRITNFTQSRFPVGKSAPAHSHSDMYEVFLVEAGRGVFVINSVEYPVSVGSCIRIDLYEMHEIRNIGDEELILTYFGIEV